MNPLIALLNSPTTSIEELVDKVRPYDKRTELPMSHFFGDNLYVRQAVYPKGTLIVGRIHKFDHVFMLLSGKITVWTRDGKTTLTGPCIFESKAGVQRIGYVHQNAVCLNMHGIQDNTQIDEFNSDDVLTAETDKEYSDFLKVVAGQARVERCVSQTASGLPEAYPSCGEARQLTLWDGDSTRSPIAEHLRES